MTRKRVKEDKPCYHLTSFIRKMYEGGILRYTYCTYCGEITRRYEPWEKKKKGE